MAEEKYASNCLVSKFTGFSSAMAYTAISGLGKGPLILMDKNWGKINSQIYIEKVLPHFYKHLREMGRGLGFMKVILMEDGASIHTSRMIRGYHAYHGIIRMI